MKNKILLVIFCLVFSAQLPLAKASSDEYTEILLQGDDQKLTQVAKALSGVKNASEQHIDMLAEILLRKYPNAYPSDVDTLAWVARAIGESGNGRYRGVLELVISDSDHAKLVKYAKKALKNLEKGDTVQYSKGMYDMPVELYAPQSQRERDAEIMILTLNGNLKDLKRAAKLAVEGPNRNTEITDLFADILMAHSDTASDHQIDAFSWVVTALGGALPGRYGKVLDHVVDSGAHKKLRKYAKKARSEHGDTDAEQYYPASNRSDLPSYQY